MSDCVSNNGELYHYGVKGMKWGVRKTMPVSITRKRHDNVKKTLEKRKLRKTAIKNAYKSVTENSSLFEKFVYNNATRKKAAKLMVDHNMSMADAKKRANKTAIANTAVILGLYGGYMAVQAYHNR